MTDRELDALVAEKVMDLQVVDVPFVPAELQKGAVLTDAAAAEYAKVYPRGMRCKYIDRYSTSIADVWQVVERMRSDGYSFECYCSDHRDYHNAQFYCSLGPCEKHGSTDINRGHGAEVTAKPSLPLAICLAALDAITKVEACGKRVGKVRK